MRYAVALAVLAAGPLGAAGQDEESKDVQVVREWKGRDTRITEPEYRRITDAEAWGELWQRHTGRKDKAPEVDFAKNMVVACFLGGRRHDEVSLYRVRQTKEEIVFGVMLEGEDCCDFSKHPLYYVAVIPRSNLKIALIARVRQELDVDPKKDELLKELPATEK